MSSDYACVKRTVFFFNFLFWLVGCVLLALGVWAHVDPQFVETHLKTSGDADVRDAIETITTYIRYMALGSIILGATIAVMGFFGCCGAVRQSKGCLGAFFFLLMLSFIVTLVIGGFLMFMAASAESDDPIAKKINDAFTKLVEAAWQAMSEEQKRGFENANQCCGLSGEGFDRALCGVKPGCFSMLVGEIRSHFWIAGAVLLGMGAIELIAMSMACCLFQRIRTPYAAV